MIATDIVYIRARTAEEAIGAWLTHARGGGASPETVRYFAGGTELITASRKSAGGFQVAIDIKRIDELGRLEETAGRLFLGAALPLNRVRDWGLFPLLSACIRRIADRTVRNRLSLGGNIAGSLPYREAALPLLLADARILTIAPPEASDGTSADGTSANGTNTAVPPQRRERPLRDCFNKRLALEPGELILGFSIDAAAAERPWFYDRAVRSSPVDYPLATCCCIRNPTSVSVAFSGLHPYPVFFDSIEAARFALSLPGTVRADQRASAKYRTALARGMLDRAEEALA